MLSNLRYIKDISQVDTDKEYLCPKCFGKITYSIVSTKTEISEYYWSCDCCGTEFDKDELKIEIIKHKDIDPWEVVVTNNIPIGGV